jgi:large subunit ribosomal protein L23
MPCATKQEVGKAVEMLFKVEVEAVRILNRKGKSKRTGRGMGRRSSARIAYVALKKGQEIRFDEEVK